MARYEARLILTITTDELSDSDFLSDEFRSDLLSFTGSFIEPQVDEDGEETDIEKDIVWRVASVEQCQVRRQTD